MSKTLKQKLKKMPVRMMKLFINRYRPYKGAAIKTSHIAKDYSHIKVHMPLKWYNKNLFGTQFGGSLFSMTDAGYPIILNNLLGKRYIIWDKEASIRYTKPGRTTVRCEFQVTPEELKHIIDTTAQEGKMLLEKQIDLIDDEQDVVATVKRIIYIKDKQFEKEKMQND